MEWLLDGAHHLYLVCQRSVVDAICRPTPGQLVCGIRTVLHTLYHIPEQRELLHREMAHRTQLVEIWVGLAEAMLSEPKINPELCLSIVSDKYHH